MKASWKRTPLALAFVAIFLVSDIGMGLRIDPLPQEPEASAVDAVERTWGGGGSRILFADDMSGGLARYLEGMDPLPDGEPFDYYGGAVPQVDAGEVFGLWQADRWRHEWWRWGEESMQFTESNGRGEAISAAWNQTDGEGSHLLHFGDLSSYPGGVFSGLVSPVVDLRDVEPVGRGVDAAVGFRPPEFGLGNGGGPTIENTLDNTLAQAGLARNMDSAEAALPAPHNSSAALRLRHAYGFATDASGLKDGARLEVSTLDPVQGWLDWQPLLPSANALRVGEAQLEGRYAAPGGHAGVGFDRPPTLPSAGVNGTATPTPGFGGPMDAYLDANVAGSGSLFGSTFCAQGNQSAINVPGMCRPRPWMYQGQIPASSGRDPRDGTWSGFGGQSGGLVESVFDLTPHAGQLVRFRFVVATDTDDDTTPGLGWALDQMEVHAVGDGGVQILAPVTPTEGALLEPDADPPITIAVQNTHPEAVEVRLRAGIEGAGSAAQRITLPPGPWGRVFHTFQDSLRDLAPDASGLQHLDVAVNQVSSTEGTEVVSPVPAAEDRFHFQLGGPERWEPVRVVTELVPMSEDDQTQPESRLLKRGQEMLVHVDLQNLGPEPVTLDFSTDPPLEPLLLDTFSAPRGTFTPPGEVELPPSRDASGSLGEADAVRRVTWTWSGLLQATLLDLYVDRIDGGNRTRPLDGGGVRVETMQPSVLSVDLDNYWDYDSPGQSGCTRRAAEDGRDGTLLCAGDNITSPVGPVYPTDLRRGNDTHLFVVYKGEGSITLQVNESDPDAGRPDEVAQWTTMTSQTLDPADDWNVTLLDIQDFPKGWRGWIQALVQDAAGAGLEVDELRVEVGPEGRRLPLLWQTFSADLVIETSGSLRSATGGQLVVLDGAAARASDVQEEEYEDDDVEMQGAVNNIYPYTIYLDSKASELSLLQLPGTYVLSGARPTLRFDHWMDASPSAVGHVEVARVDALERAAGSENSLDWTPVATFVAPREAGDVALESVSVPLWDHAGQEVMLRFRYQLDQALQPNALPAGWVLDRISVDQVLSEDDGEDDGVEVLHEATGDYAADGYSAFGARFEEEVEGAHRALPRKVDEVYMGSRGDPMWVEKEAFRFGMDGVGREKEKYNVCADPYRPSTYNMGQSIITDPVDLRALDDPVLVLEHGGRFLGRPFGRMIFDLEFQVLGSDGAWGPWQRSAAYDANWQPLPFYLHNASSPDGGFVGNPFAAQRWGERTDPTTDGYERLLKVDLLGDNATRFLLSTPGGPAGEIARFRFHLWEEYQGNGRCGGAIHNAFDWYVYSMKVFEDTHLFDTAPTAITLSRDDRALLDQAGASGGLDPDAAVVAGDKVVVDVPVRNHGDLVHLANVTLQLLREDGSLVEGAVRFVDRSGGGVGQELLRGYGHMPLAPGKEEPVRFHVYFNLVEPGNYTLRAVADIDDALDTNPRNDLLTRQVRVAPIRSLQVDSSARVFPAAGTPEDDRTLTAAVANKGNVRDSVTVHAKVVELLGVGLEADIGPNGEPYTLEPEHLDGLVPRTGRQSLQWDLVRDVADDNNLTLEDLLKPGSRYGVNITLVPDATVPDWWTPGGGEIDAALLSDLSDPGTRCGCTQIPFLVEDLIASSDLTDHEAKLAGYVDGGLADWQTTTRVRTDGVWEDVDDRPDLPAWEVLDNPAAANLTGAAGSGDAWHLPPYDGFEQVEHTLTSPPLPGHIIDSKSQAILDLRYAVQGDGRGDAQVEVRTLEPGGRWGEWGPVDGLRAQRVAVVVPPDYPQVISNRTTNPNVPPFYTAEAAQNNLQPIQYTEGGPNVGLISAVSTGIQGCNSPNAGWLSTLRALPDECHWSPFPMYPRPGEAGHNYSLEVLATVLRRLSDELGPENVNVFTTFPQDPGNTCHDGTGQLVKPRAQCFGEFGIPEDGIAAGRGIEFNTTYPPRLVVPSARNVTLPHELPVLELDRLGQDLSTYGAVLLLGDGLARYAAGQEEGTPHHSPTAVRLGKSYAEADLTNAHLQAAGLGNLEVTLPQGPNVTTEELDRHFQELLQILRFAPGAGVGTIGGLGPAPATIGLSGVAEDVPLALWIPARTRLNTGEEDIPVPLNQACLVNNAANIGRTFTGVNPNDFYLLNLGQQPKPLCWRSAGPGTTFTVTGYVYSSAPDIQATILREALERGGADFNHVRTICLGPFSCVMPASQPISHQHNGLHFVTASQEGQANAWIEQVLDSLQTDGSLPPGSGTWEDLPLTMATPVGGTFRPGPDGAPRFVGETMQFRVVVQSDPDEQGHDRLLLDRFRLLGTPPSQADLEVRVADPEPGSLRQPGERGFYVTAEVINRGVNATEESQVEVQMAQVPGDGDCGGDCIVHRFHPDSLQTEPPIRTVQVPPLGPGARYVVTLGPEPLEAEPGAPAGITYAAFPDPFNDGTFPKIPETPDPDPEVWFDIAARITTGPPTDHDGFAVLNDAHSAIVVGKNVVNPLLKDPERDILVTPRQAALAGASGTSAAEAIPVTDHVDVQVRLTNDGSSANQVGGVAVEVHAALPHVCLRGNGKYSSCEANGANQPIPLWEDRTALQGLAVPRGESTLYGPLRIPLADAGLSPGVYRVHVEVTTLDAQPIIRTYQRWVYLTDPAQGPWAFLQEDLSGIQGNNALWSRTFPPTQNPPGATPFFSYTANGHNTACQVDPTTQQGNSPGGPSLLHGWRFSDATGDACQASMDPGNHALHWMRSPQASVSGTPSWVIPTIPNNQPTTTAGRGLSDFGPDALIWYPGHGNDPVGPVNSQTGPNRIPESLANFAPGSASLVLDTRFQATPNTAYVVEMQVPVWSCQNLGPRGTNCQWNWNWGGPNAESTHWFPLQAVEGVTTANPPIGAGAQSSVCNPFTNPFNNQAMCQRPANTNPLGGLPGIWGSNSTDHAKVDGEGWLLARYPIDPAVQNHTVVNVVNGQSTVLYQGLDGYCASLIIGGPNGGDSRLQNDGLRGCLYAWAQGGTGQPAVTSVKEEIPRPVAFRLRAASYGGDAGANRWQVRDLTLTAHDLELAGAEHFRVPFTDGDTKAIPVEIRNAGSVDDVVEVTASPDISLGPDLVVGVSKRSLDEPLERLLLPIPPGETRTAWVHVHFDYGAGGLSPDAEHHLPISISARSVIAPSIAIGATVDAVLQPLHRADLALASMVVDGNEVGTVDAAEGVPVHTTLLVRNQGSRPVDGEPVLVRLIARELDPDNRTNVIDTEAVAQTIVTEELGSHCFLPRCSVPVTLDWTPDRQGIFDLVAELNLPRLGDDVVQVPEFDDGNNIRQRRVNVGAVPLADLQVLDVRVVPFDGGCASLDENVTRLIAGHSYCLAALVRNDGRRAAVNPVAEFSIGASSPFSRGQGDGLPNPLDGSTSAWVFTTPVRAALPREGNLMEFQVRVETDSATASVDAKDRSLFIPVDDYDLEVFAGDVSALELEKGATGMVTLRIRNSGTAVATPQLETSRLDGLRIHMVQPPPLQPGEEAEATLELRTGHSAEEGLHPVQVVFSTSEDHLVHVPLDLRPIILGNGGTGASVLPLRAAPGNATLDVVIDNTGRAGNGTWDLVETTGPLTLLSSDPIEVAGHDVVLRDLPFVVPAQTPPGDHAGILRFLVTQGAVSTIRDVPYDVTVLPGPAATVHVEEPDLAVVRGGQAQILLSLENLGNVPVELTLSSSVDSGRVHEPWQNLTLEPGADRSVPIMLHAEEAGRSLGQTHVRWRFTESNWTHEETVLWSVRYVPGSVRISSTDLHDVDVRPGAMQTVRVFLTNPGNDSVEAEAVLVVDGVLQSRQRVSLPANTIQPVDLSLQVEEGEHVVQVVARPAGAGIGLSDPVFHAVGDVNARELEVVQEDDGLLPDLSIPIPGMTVSLLVMLGVALARRRRR